MKDARPAVEVGEQNALAADAIDVGRGHHHPVAVDADVGVADVVGHDDQDVRALDVLRQRWCRA
jgi:hypothetical protein